MPLITLCFFPEREATVLGKSRIALLQIVVHAGVDRGLHKMARNSTGSLERAFSPHFRWKEQVLLCVCDVG
jgi:hypothetical protein